MSAMSALAVNEGVLIDIRVFHNNFYKNNK